MQDHNELQHMAQRVHNSICCIHPFDGTFIKWNSSLQWYHSLFTVTLNATEIPLTKQCLLCLHFSSMVLSWCCLFIMEPSSAKAVFLVWLIFYSEGYLKPFSLAHAQRNSSRLWLIFSCDQAALWMVQSVCPSVRPSVCLSVCLSVTPFWLCSHHPIIMKFSGVITSDKSDVHAKGQGQRSKVKVTEVTTQLNRFRTVTPVWIHIWWWNDVYSLMMLKRGALLFLKVIRQISRSHGHKKRRIWPRLGVSGL